MTDNAVVLIKYGHRADFLNDQHRYLFSIYTRGNVEELTVRRERQTRSMMAAKERYEKTSRDRQSLAEEVQKQELQLKKALNKRKKALLEKM